MEPVYFESPLEFRRWLEANHGIAAELWVGFHKKGTGRPSMTWPESVDEALCFGWIDGVRKRVDDDRYVIRFTPRRRGSIWSTVNTKRAAELIRDDRMRPAGRSAYDARDPARSGVYSFEQPEAARLSADEEARFRAHDAAWRFFESQPASYRRTALWWIVSAKRAATRGRRLDTLVADSAAGRRLAHLSRPSSKQT